MAIYEDERLAVSARYISSSRELEITLDDGSRHLIPVDRLEMVESAPDAYVPIAKPSDEQLGDVKVWGGGSAIYWESIEQVFRVDELMAGIYGRPAWMKNISVSV
ncbi:DUF2442 domain-containing protein [cf. Phormidesmis sp. LEGE 11477]|uniref:DUF2442 domain-containing protein n=1 Tax=cf. Phormidesmis sp. LEGE 11477 TaxID=1828680 RepID=UPI00187F85CE|nr:DUF2442 domain-containing protein [cf. Phormidesmis sp. LEGE 11477]MBE9061237.1 DUF2442 domain-containing protein [cf. Phormidesmis sp. LEGE 11477]